MQLRKRVEISATYRLAKDSGPKSIVLETIMLEA